MDFATQISMSRYYFQELTDLFDEIDSLTRHESKKTFIGTVCSNSFLEYEDHKHSEICIHTYIKYMVMYAYNNMHGYNNVEAGLGGITFST